MKIHKDNSILYERDNKIEDLGEQVERLEKLYLDTDYDLELFRTSCRKKSDEISKLKEQLVDKEDEILGLCGKIKKLKLLIKYKKQEVCKLKKTKMD